MKSSYTEICVITDNGYTVPTIVMLTSAKINKAKDSNYRVHCILNEVNEVHRNMLMELDADDFRIVLYTASLDKYKTIQVKGHVPVSVMLKLDIATLLADVSKVLYLDGDILVKKDLSEFYNTDLGNKPLAAVRDIGGELRQHFNTRIGVKEYINAGVMLMNLDTFRKEDIGSRMLEIQLSAPEEWLCLEQDNINVFFKDRMLLLPFRYNALLPMCLNGFYHFDAEDLNQFYGTNYSSLEDAEADAVLIHFAGESSLRPWKILNGTYANVWQMYYDLSPLRNHWLRLEPYTPPAPAPVVPEPAPVVTEPAPVVPEPACCSPAWQEECCRLNLFGFLPLLKINRNPFRTKVKLFHFIPLLRIKHKDSEVVVYLFGFLLLWNSRTKIQQS